MEPRAGENAEREADGRGAGQRELAVMLPLDRLTPSPFQARRVFDETRLARLAESIASVGVLQPVLVRPLPDGRYELIAGERRCRAARQVGLTEIPCIVRECDDAEAQRLGLLENLQREDLSEIDKSDALCTYRTARGITWAQVAEDVRLTPNRVKQGPEGAPALQRLPEAVKEAVRSGRITGGAAHALLPLPLKEQMELLELAASRRLRVDQVRVLAAERRAAGDGGGVARNTRSQSKAVHRFLEAAHLLELAAGSLPPDRKRELLDVLRPLVTCLAAPGADPNSAALSEAATAGG